MANYDALKTAIRNAVYENGNNEITGQALQDVLEAVVNSLGSGFQFASVATTETEPGTPDSNVMYIAGAGTYPNFGGTVVPQGDLGVFYYNGTWRYQVINISSVGIGEAESDLDITDEIGNAIARFSNGHFQTKNFNSQTIVETMANLIRVQLNTYVFRGVVTPETELEEDDIKKFYIAKSGVYPNFDNTNIPNGNFGVFMYDGQDWDYNIIDIASWVNSSNKLYYNTQESDIQNKSIQADGFTLEDGGWLKIKFAHPNTSINPTLNINNTGSFPITLNGIPVSDKNTWKAEETIAFVYYNNEWNGYRLVDYPDFINVNSLINQSSAFTSKLNARKSIPIAYRKLGLNITYLLVTQNTNEWIEEKYIGANIEDWNTEANWQLSNINDSGVEVGEAEADLDIADENNNAIARFSNGHFKTKNFDSAKNNANIGIDDFDVFSEDENYNTGDIVKYDGLLYKFVTNHNAGIWNIEEVNRTSIADLEKQNSVEVGEAEADLDITDENGNAIARFSNGHFKTKYFDSENIKANGNGKDWSDEDSIIELPLPEFIAMININCSRLPTSQNKDDDLKGELEYCDRLGNYFKKKISKFNLQGRTSLRFPKHNFSFDIEDGTKIQFGKWVAQDSFHLKANYIDAFRGGSSIISYRVQNNISELNDWQDARPWRKMVKSNVTLYNGLGILNDDINCNALGQPDGFPCELYINSIFYGIYTLNLKKHRDNMVMSNVNAQNIHLDGEQFDIFFSGVSNIDWTLFEIRNPKNLVYAKSDSDSAQDRKYNADVSKREIAGETPTFTAGNWDSRTLYRKNSIVKYNNRLFLSLVNSNTNNTPVPCTNPKKVFDNATAYWIDITFTNEVKQYIIRFANSNSNISSKANFENYLDSEWSIDYVLQVNAFMNVDALRNNTQWCTWDGNKWFPMAYDQDQCYGLYWTGTKIRGNGDSETSGQEPDSLIIGVGIQTGTPLSKLFTLFKTEMDARYKELIDNNILTTKNIIYLLNKWVANIGIDNFEAEFSKWNETPSYRNGNNTYQNYPQTGGFYNSIIRVDKYMTVRENFLKQYFNY